MQRGISLLLCCALLALACSSGRQVFRPDALRAGQRWAVASVFFRAQVDDRTQDPGEADPLSVTLSLGRGFSLDKALHDVEASIAQQHVDYLTGSLPGVWLPYEAVTAPPAYAELPQPWDKASYEAPVGLRPLHMEKPAQLGAFAAALDVDAVFIIRHRFTLERVDAISFAMADEMTLVAVARDGELLWDTTKTGLAPLRVHNVSGGVANFFDSVTPQQSGEALAESARITLDSAFLPLRTQR